MILIIDDDESVGRSLARRLRVGGYNTASVTSGAFAIEMMRRRLPTLVILDVHMRPMDGLTVLRTIKEDDHLRNVPVLMYSADPSDHVRRESMRLGAADFVAKSEIARDAVLALIVALAGPACKRD